jgi:hypothetical protein
MIRQLTLALIPALILMFSAFAQDSQKDSQNKSVDVHSSAGDLHVGNDGDAKKVGLPLYPGARFKSDDKNNSQANLSVLTEAFGMKLVVAHYETDDAPGKVVDFYRDKLKKYGKVVECHAQKHGDDIDVHEGKDSKDKELKCDEDSGPVTKLQVGTEDNQHAVAIEPADSGKGSTFTLVYVHTRGKSGEI